ncbi:MAG TPA: DUF4038 domain-containing protein [Fimbriiglobus sp.]|jgi:hypothetical protein
MKTILSVCGLAFGTIAFAAEPFDTHGPLRVAKSGTYLEHADGTPFFFLADTCWTGPALSTEKDWQTYLVDRKKKGFTAIQFNMVCPWRTAATDAEGNVSYFIKDGKLSLNEPFYRRLDARLEAINDAGLLAVPVLCWACVKGDPGIVLNEEQVIDLCRLEVERYKSANVLWILIGDNRYAAADAVKWKRVGRAVFGEKPGTLVTTHPSGENWPWNSWDDEKWLTVLGYQSGHGDSVKSLQWMTEGPVAAYGKRKSFSRPVINLEPPYENHYGYSMHKPHPASDVRRAVYWSLLRCPEAGFTYGAHGVWSWNTKPGTEPTGHKGTGIANVWSDAINLPGATQMGYVRKLMEEVQWTTLRPLQTVVKQVSAEKDPGTFVAAAASPDNGTYVFYFPAHAEAIVALQVRGMKDAIRWFNPRTGVWGKPPGANPKHPLFGPPDENDWVLVVKP